MQRLKKIIIFIMVISFIPMSSDIIFGMSPTQKAANDYRFILYNLRTIRIILDNFGTDDQKKRYSEIQLIFKTATEEYYARKFVSSHQKFYKTKEGLIELLKQFSALYLNRAQEILDSTSKKSFDIFVKYNKYSDFARFFAKPFDPINDIKAYEEDEYHLFHDNHIIESYLKNGYSKLEFARNILKDPDFLLIIDKKKKTSRNLEYILNKHIDVITQCRIAKLYGIEIHKIININKLSGILSKYQLKAMNLDPIFDDRIPEEYKVDANDNISFKHSYELQRLSKHQKQLQ